MPVGSVGLDWPLTGPAVGEVNADVGADVGGVNADLGDRMPVSD